MMVTVWWLRLALRLIRQAMLVLTQPVRQPTVVVLRMQGWCLGLLAGLATKALTAVLLTMAQDWRVGLLRVWARLPLMEALLILLLMIRWVLLLLLTALMMMTRLEMLMALVMAMVLVLLKRAQIAALQGGRH